MSAAPSWEVAASLGVHLILALIASVAKCAPDRPAPKAQEVIMVEVGGLPMKQTTAMPQKAERAPNPVKGSDAAPTPPTPPPPQESKLAYETPDAPTKKGDPKADKLREEMMAEMRRRQLLQDMEAPVGKEDRAKTDPNGTTDPNAVGNSNSVASKQELAVWSAAVLKVVKPNWHPIIAICQTNPALTVTIKAPVDAQGNLTAPPSVGTPSGNSSVDGSALRAVEATAKLPPPPAAYANGLTAKLVFECKDVI